jgi:putative transposase
VARKPRVEFNGAIYHVYQRGNNKEFIFQNEIEKNYMIKQIKEFMKVYDYEILCYTIMSNHYHIIIRTNEIPLSKIMHRINNIYSKFYNCRNERTGHVFEGRYSCKLIDNDAYLIRLLRYIHKNPVRANIVSNISSYRWSSDYFYRNNKDSFVKIDFILKLFSERRKEALMAYSKFMSEDYKNENEENESIKVKFPHISFEPYDFMPQSEEKYSQDTFKKRDTLEEILRKFSNKDEVYDLIKLGSRKRCLTDSKVQFINAALELKYTIKEIGDFIGISQTAVLHLIS